MAQFIPCSVNVNGTAATTLASKSLNLGMERVLVAAAGNYQAEFVALMRQIPRLSWSTRKINALEAVVLGAGNAIFRTVAEGGVGGSTYVSVTGTNGAVLHVPKRVSWQAGSPAVLEAEMIFLSSNGIAAPLTVGSTAGATTAESAVWSGDVEQCYSIEVDFGFEIALPQDGLLFQKHSFIVSQRPMIKIGSYDSAGITTANLNPGSISTLTAILAALADGGVRGTQKSYALTGHYHVESVNGVKPGTVMISCAGENGLTIS